MTYFTIRGDCIDRMTAQNGDRVLFERLATPRPAPKVTLKRNWQSQQQQKQQPQQPISHTDVSSIRNLEMLFTRARRLETHRRSRPSTGKPAAIHFSCCLYTPGRSEWTHGGVFNLHTEGFSACQAAPHKRAQHAHTTQTRTPPALSLPPSLHTHIAIPVTNETLAR